MCIKIELYKQKNMISFLKLAGYVVIIEHFVF